MTDEPPRDFDGRDLDGELERRLREAVEPIVPGPGSFEALRARVATRRRRRQLVAGGGVVASLTGITAAAVLAGPARLDVVREWTGSAASSSSPARPEPDQRARHTPPEPVTGPSPHANPSGAAPVPHSPRPRPSASHPDTAAPSRPGTPSAAGAPSPTPTASGSAAPVAGCAGGQLRPGRSELVDRAAGGVGYGFLELVNGSVAACAVTRVPVGTVVERPGGADAGFRRSARSPAESPALADVADRAPLVLRPGEAVRFQFAWTNRSSTSQAGCVGPKSPNPDRTWVLRYRVSGQVVAQLPLPTACRGFLYQTGGYRPGEYPEAFAG